MASGSKWPTCDVAVGGRIARPAGDGDRPLQEAWPTPGGVGDQAEANPSRKRATAISRPVSGHSDGRGARPVHRLFCRAVRQRMTLRRGFEFAKDVRNIAVAHVHHALCRGAIEWRAELNAVFAGQDAGAEVFLGDAVLEPAINITPPGNPARYPPPGRFASGGRPRRR